MISRIDGTSSLSSSVPVKKKGKAGKTSDTSFSKHLDSAEETTAADATSSLGAVAGVLDIQEVDDALERAARGKLRAEDLLEKMDDLRLDILEGKVSPQKLQNLSETVASHRPDISDPKLSGILDEIDLRAQVELAKFSSAQ